MSPTILAVCDIFIHRNMHTKDCSLHKPVGTEYVEPAGSEISCKSCNPPYAQSRHYYIAYGYCASRRKYYAFIYFTPISSFALMDATISLSLIILSYPDDNALSSVVSSKYSSIAISSSLTPSVSLPLVLR